MVDSIDRRSARWVLPLLVVLLVLGHACELPAYAELVEWSHAAGESHHHSQDGHHAGGEALSCDPVTAVPGSGHPHVTVALGISVVPEVGDPVSARLVTRSLEGPDGRSSRPPLFLLHASFLI